MNKMCFSRTALALAVALMALPAFGQSDFAGEWAPLFHEDNPERLPGPELSARETEILRLIANGQTNKQIATQLGISEGTVRVHASNVFAKLGCSDRAQAVAVACSSRRLSRVPAPRAWCPQHL